jgi:hypothetical protein
MVLWYNSSILNKNGDVMITEYTSEMFEIVFGLLFFMSVLGSTLPTMIPVKVTA